MSAPLQRLWYAAWAAACASALGCGGFDLDSRRFRCEDTPEICGPGWTCSAEGFCRRADGSEAPGSDAGPGDGAEVCGNGEDDDDDGDIDCLDSQCGPESCVDTSPCTVDRCLLDGSCENAPLLAGETCGIGCMCDAGGVAVEIACGDLMDNDGDQAPDCNDPDCPACMGTTVCCPDGGCRLTCG